MLLCFESLEAFYISFHAHSVIRGILNYLLCLQARTHNVVKPLPVRLYFTIVLHRNRLSKKYYEAGTAYKNAIH